MGGHLARTTFGLAAAATSGTRSIREEYALPVFTGGLRLSVFRAVAGRRIRIGMRGEPGEVAVISSAEITHIGPSPEQLYLFTIPK